MFIRKAALPVIVGTVLLAGTSSAQAATTAVSAPKTLVTPSAYLITSLEAGSAAGQVSQEVLTFGRNGNQALVRLQDRSGDAVVAPAAVEPNGAVQTALADPALTCYNVAMAVASDASTRDKTSSLFLTFGGGTVTVPLQLTSAASQSNGTQTVSAHGSTQTTVNDGTNGTNITLTAVGTVTSMQSTLLAARFDETGTLTGSDTAITRTSCTVIPLVRRVQPQEPSVPLVPSSAI